MKFKIPMGFSTTQDMKSLLKKAADDHYEKNISMVINIAVKEWLHNHGYIRKTHSKANH